MRRYATWAEPAWICFFVLSGYLIANPLLSGLAAGRQIDVLRSDARRWLRTVPLF